MSEKHAILIVDDQPEILNALERLLKEDYTVHTTTSGHQALDMLQDQYIETQHRNNQKELDRARLLIELEPFRHLTVNEVREMYSAGLISFEDYMLKANFSSLLAKFERENSKITEFGEGMPIASKVQLLETQLKTYILRPQSQIN